MADKKSYSSRPPVFSRKVEERDFNDNLKSIITFEMVPYSVTSNGVAKDRYYLMIVKNPIARGYDPVKRSSVSIDPCNPQIKAALSDALNHVESLGD